MSRRRCAGPPRRLRCAVRFDEAHLALQAASASMPSWRRDVANSSGTPVHLVAAVGDEGWKTNPIFAEFLWNPHFVVGHPGELSQLKDGERL